MKYFSLVFLVFLFGGCSIKVPAVTSYKIDTKVKTKRIMTNGCKKSSIKVAKAFAPTYLSMTDMFYVVDGQKQLSYNSSKWAISPKSMVTQEFEKLLRDSNFYGVVTSYKSRAKTDFVVEVSIDEFMQHFSKDLKRTYGVVTLTLNIINTKTLKVVSSKHFTYRVDTNSLDADGGVDSLKIALSEVLSEVNDYFIENCR